MTVMVVPKNCGLLSRGHVSHTQPILSEADSGRVVGNRKLRLGGRQLPSSPSTDRNVGNISMDHRTLLHHSVHVASLERQDQPLSNEETSTQGRSPFRKAGSAKSSFLRGACHALRRRCRRGPQQTGRTSNCACERLRYTVRIVSAFCRTETEETTSLCRTSHRSFYVRGSAFCKNRAGSRRTRSTVSRPHSGEAVSRSSSRTSRRQRRDARSLLSTRRNVSKVDHRERLPSGSC